ncbi:uncharacterized protein LOC131938350 [Physella acuta]|uniref:uncharacterized protein LOC131938350 n=1 Tax=Physella acuta TaxID=109671 RepID=UPI0027DAC91B|nr:uncharacterized protein LOC131938350 [Physella acuta]
MNQSGIVVSVVSGIASDADRDAYGVALSVVSSIVCTFGTLANAVNVMVFLRQGVSDTVTISFLTLSLSDFGVTITMIGVGLCFSPLVVNAGFPVNTFDLSYIIGWTHIVFARISSGITAFVSFERCLCIAMPLKVKSIITTTRAYIILTVITIIMTLSTVPVFYTSRMAWTFDRNTNRTILSMIFTDDRDFVDGISFGHQHRLSNPVNLHLHRHLCNDPNRFFTAIIVPEFNVGMREQNLLFITGTFTLLLQAVNSSVSIFIYYNMSSKYKKTFMELFSLCF